MEKAAIRKKGEHLTIVSWGNGVEIALNAASDLRKRGLSTEVIDLRTIVPCDWAAIHKSVRKTGRLIVLQEDNKTVTGYFRPSFTPDSISLSYSARARSDLMGLSANLVFHTRGVSSST